MKYCRFILVLIVLGSLCFAGLMNNCYAKNIEKSMKRISININKANIEEFETIKGIGESLAERIVVYRDENGSFKNKEDLMKVKGIGEKKYEKIKNYLVL